MSHQITLIQETFIIEVFDMPTYGNTHVH